MLPWNPPPPVPRNRPFHVFSGSHTSILMAESGLGVSVAVTRQNAGRPVIFCGGLEPGTTKKPLVLSVAEVIGVSLRDTDCRLVDGVAVAGVLPMATAARRPAEGPARDRRCILLSPLIVVMFGRHTVDCLYRPVVARGPQSQEK